MSEQEQDSTQADGNEDEFESAFASAPSADTEKKAEPAKVEATEATAKESPKEAGIETKAEATEAKAEVKEEKPAEPKPKTAIETMLDESKSKETEKTQAAEQKAAEQVKTETAKTAAKVGLDALPETYEHRGRTYNTKDVLEVYGEDGEGLIALIAGQTAQAALRAAIESGAVVPADKLSGYEKRIEAQEQRSAHQDLLIEAGRISGLDAHTINDNPDHDFYTWLKTSPAIVQAYAASAKGRDVGMALKAYAEHLGTENAAKIDKEKGEKKQKHDDLHGSTLRNEKGQFVSVARSTQDSETEFEEAFSNGRGK